MFQPLDKKIMAILCSKILLCFYSIFQDLYCQNNHTSLKSEYVKQRASDVKQQGNVLTFVNKGKCYLLTPLEVAEQNSFKVTFLDGSVGLSKVSLG